MPRNPHWRIPEDGIIDHIAVEIAVKGTRRVKLTTKEMMLAAREIIINGGTADTLMEHIGLSETHAHDVYKKIRNGDGESSG